MRVVFAVAALLLASFSASFSACLLASTAAKAQYTFEYGGRTIRIDPDRGTVSIPGVYDNTGRPTKRSRNDHDDGRRPKSAPEQAKTDPQSPAPGPAPSEPAPASANVAPDPSAATASKPAETGATISPSASAPANPPAQQDQPSVAAAPAASPTPSPATPPAAAAPSSGHSPLGLWLTEQKEGKVRIEQCGVSLCGYSVDSKSNHNGEQVLINMKPAPDSKWAGRILDLNTGSTYDSTIALTGTDTLRVQGCAFGGMFCGGQTWSRLN